MHKNKRKHTYVFKRNTSLKKEVYKLIKITNVGIYKEIRKDKSPWWAPSPKKILVYSIITIIIGLISHIHELGILPICTTYINSYLVTKMNDYLIEICIGISAVLVGLAFFIAQSFLDKEDPDRGRVLLYTSKFFLLLSGSIVILLIYIFGKPNIIIDIFIGILGILTIWSLYQTVKVLLYENEMEKARLRLLKGIIKRFILHELCRRISYQVVFKANEELQNKYNGISINPFKKINNGVKIKAKKSGTVTDIKLGKFERLFLKAEKREMSGGNNGQSILNMHIMPYHNVNENSTLIQMQKDNFTSFLLKKSSEKQIRSVFTIRKADYEEKTEIEISKLKQRCLLLIEQERVDELEKALSAFKEITNLFISIFDKVNWSFKKEQAEKERGAFLGERFKLLDWILDTINTIFYKAINSDNMFVIKTALYLPISLSVSAIKRNDHLIFQYFIRYPVFMYIEGYKRKRRNKEAFEFFIEKSWRYLKELSDFYLEYPYEEGEIKEQDFLDYTIYIFKVFQDLLKQSYDKRDIESFKIYLSRYILIYEYLEYDRYKRKGQSIFDKINALRNQTLFGVGSWIFDNHFNNKEKINKTYLDEVFQVWKPDIINLTELFINVYRDNDMWGWDDWEMESKEEGKAHFLNITGKLEKFYIVMCLRALQSKPSIDNIRLPFSSELASLTDTLIKIINSINEDPEKWDILRDNQILKCNDLIRLLERAKEQQKEKEAKSIRDTPVSIDKVNAFKEGILKSMQTLQGIKGLLKFYKAIILEEERSTMSDNFGIDVFFEKEYFIDSEELNTISVGFDESIGESMISGENLNILQKFYEESKEIPEGSFKDYLDCIEDMEKVIIIAINYQAYDYFGNKYDSSTYIANWYTNFPDKLLEEFPEGLEGILIYKRNRIPVYEYFNSLPFKGIFIADIKKVKLSQYPLNFEGDEQYIIIDVQGFEPGSHEEDVIIKNAPEWLKKIGDEEAQRHYIEERVVVKVFEQFDLKIDKNAVARISLE